MTPEDRAERLADELDHMSRMGGIVTRDHLAEVVAAAIREAVSVEREACALVVENLRGGNDPFCCEPLLESAAKSIRARGGKP